MAVFSHTTSGLSAKAVCSFYDLNDITYLYVIFLICIIYLFLLFIFLSRIRLGLEETKLHSGG